VGTELLRAPTEQQSRALRALLLHHLQRSPAKSRAPRALLLQHLQRSPAVRSVRASWHSRATACQMSVHLLEQPASARSLLCAALRQAAQPPEMSLRATACQMLARLLEQTACTQALLCAAELESPLRAMACRLSARPARANWHSACRALRAPTEQQSRALRASLLHHLQRPPAERRAPRALLLQHLQRPPAVRSVRASWHLRATARQRRTPAYLLQQRACTQVLLCAAELASPLRAMARRLSARLLQQRACTQVLLCAADPRVSAVCLTPALRAASATRTPAPRAAI